MLEGGVLRLTNSEMSAWRMCKRHWYISTYLRLRHRRTPTANHPLTIGTRVHDALEKYYQPEGSPRTDPVAWVEQSYTESIEADPIGEVELLKEKDLVLAMVEGYMEWLEETGIDREIRVLAPETKLEMPLLVSDGVTLATLLSKIDARVERESDGARLALEHKTVQSLTQPLPKLKTDPQLLTEHLVEYLDLKARGEEDKRADGVLYNMLRKVKRTATAKPPFYGREDVPHNIHELRNHMLHCRAAAMEILDAHRRLDAGESHHIVCPPSPSNGELTWKSPFFQFYAMMDDGSDYEAAFADLLEEHDPLERYDDTTSLTETA